jgi:hypothetical protein
MVKTFKIEWFKINGCVDIDCGSDYEYAITENIEDEIRIAMKMSSNLRKMLSILSLRKSKLRELVV